MWKLDKIEADNLCSFRHMEYTLQQGVTTLVFGNNMDNETQRSNGSGKSALIEAVAIGLTGSPLRKVRNEEIINDNEEACRIVLTLTNRALNEEFTVERTISRREAAQVKCTIVRNGKRVTTDEAVQPTVEAYNRFVLDKLGLSKEELYNNFILSKYKYQNFLSLGDREKKEIINAFSHGNIVDKAIEAVRKDREPEEKALKEAELSVAALKGRVSMLEEQVAEQEARRQEAKSLMPQRIQELKGRIAVKQEDIKKASDEKRSLSRSIEDTGKMFAEIDALESKELPFEEEYLKLGEILSVCGINTLTDRTGLIREKQEELEAIGQATANLERIKISVEEEYQKAKEVFCGIKKERELFLEEQRQKKAELDSKISVLSASQQSVSENKASLLRKRGEIERRIERINVSLSGSVSCPQCDTRFLPYGSIDDLEGELEIKTKEKESVENLILELEEKLDDLRGQETTLYESKRMLSADISQWDEQVSYCYRESLRTEDQVSRLEREVSQSRDRCSAIQREIYSVRENMYQEAEGLLEGAVRGFERRIKVIDEKIREEEGAIATLREVITELSDTDKGESAVLQSMLEDYTAKTAQAEKEKSVQERKLNRLLRQEEYFQQYKSFLANTKINSLNHVTNRFLEDIGSDIRLNLSGYTILKSGKVREKISVSVIRNGIDCGSFGKFSAGEVARVNLATILAMQKLINDNCESGKGLDLLVLDEILEAVDEDGLAVMFGALNRIGITALIVSHGNIAESYPHKLIVRKENGESTVEY